METIENDNVMFQTLVMLKDKTHDLVYMMFELNWLLKNLLNNFVKVKRER